MKTGMARVKAPGMPMTYRMREMPMAQRTGFSMASLEMKVKSKR